MNKKSKYKLVRRLMLVGVLVLLVFSVSADQFYRLRYRNFASRDAEAHAIYVYPGATRDSVLQVLDSFYRMESPFCFRLHARYYHFDSVRPGYYHFAPVLSNQQLIWRLKYGRQDPIRLHFKNNIRTRGQLAARMGRALLLDSADVAVRLDSADYMAQFGLTTETALCLFIPNSYEVYWTMTPDELFARMYREYRAFWTDQRLAKAADKMLSTDEVAVLASIVSSETHNEAEWPDIAALYYNRLRIRMPLQADPTVVYAVGDFTIRRVLHRHLATDSPYNTYRRIGLPPGPIRLATANAMDAVLDAPDTRYVYMCANPDFSGTHVFTTNYTDHMRVARAYQRELSKRKIK